LNTSAIGKSPTNSEISYAERRRGEDQRRRRVRQLEHDRDRDERHEQVGPARTAEQEPAQVESALLRRIRGHRRVTFAG
jgi:hypothetical protein